MNENSEKYPLICLPITAQTNEKVLEELELIKKKTPDLIEFRGDFLHDIANKQQVIELINKMKEMTDIPLLFTIRSEKEGGQAISLNEVEIVDLLSEVVQHTAVDWIDYELNNQEEFIQQLIHMAHAHEKKVVLSYHNFTKTPTNELLLEYFEKMAIYQADFAKIAVMPETKADVRRLLELTAIADEKLSIPVITMSMGEIGEISRVIGWLYGSYLTFGVGVASSAPGQIAIEPLRSAIESMQKISGKETLTE